VANPSAKRDLSVIVISITPFDEQGAVDEAAFRRHLRRLGDAGVSVFVGGSGSGEGYTLTPEERDRILTIAVEELSGKVPVLADGVEPRIAKEMVRFVREVEPIKVDAVRIMPLDPGHGAKPNPAEIERFHRTVLESTQRPLILTSHQAAGYVLPIDLVERLADRYSHIRGINYGGTDTTYLAELIKRLAGRMQVHCAGCTNGLTTLTLGGNGFMGNEGNFAPTLVASVIAAFREGDASGVRESFGKLMSLAAIVRRYGGSSLRGLKPMLNAFGLPGGTLREPRLALDGAEIEKMVKAVTALQIPGAPQLPA
jgi:dihydrodipicolinate synthase/N-acetylneuraminate lyase